MDNRSKKGRLGFNDRPDGDDLGYRDRLPGETVGPERHPRSGPDSHDRRGTTTIVTPRGRDTQGGRWENNDKESRVRGSYWGNLNKGRRRVNKRRNCNYLRL